MCAGGQRREAEANAETETETEAKAKAGGMFEESRRIMLSD